MRSCFCSLAAFVLQANVSVRGRGAVLEMLTTTFTRMLIEFVIDRPIGPKIYRFSQALVWLYNPYGFETIEYWKQVFRESWSYDSRCRTSRQREATIYSNSKLGFSYAVLNWAGYSYANSE